MSCCMTEPLDTCFQLLTLWQIAWYHHFWSCLFLPHNVFFADIWLFYIKSHYLCHLPMWSTKANSRAKAYKTAQILPDSEKKSGWLRGATHQDKLQGEWWTPHTPFCLWPMQNWFMANIGQWRRLIYLQSHSEVWWSPLHLSAFTSLEVNVVSKVICFKR